jgi:serine/threonine protein kinase
VEERLMAASTVLSPGSRFTRYTTEAVVGRGGMSIVYAARDLELDRQVALKVMALSGRGDDRFRERFLRESRLAASIDHPNVIPIYDAGESGGMPLYRDAPRARHRPTALAPS